MDRGQPERQTNLRWQPGGIAFRLESRRETSPEVDGRRTLAQSGGRDDQHSRDKDAGDPVRHVEPLDAWQARLQEFADRTRPNTTVARELEILELAA